MNNFATKSATKLTPNLSKEVTEAVKDLTYNYWGYQPQAFILKRVKCSFRNYK